MNSHHGIAALAVAFVTAWGLPLSAQEDDRKPAGVLPDDLFFGEEIDVRVVNLEVVVENRDGERVPGLQRDDFRILVDGEEADVDYFTEVADGRTRNGRDRTPPAVGEGGAVATNYVLFVDDDHSLAAFGRPVLYGFRDGLAELPSRDRVAVIVQSRNRLELLSPFTTDRNATRTALAELDDGGRFGGVLRSTRFHRDVFGATAAGPSGNPVAVLSERRVPGAAGGLASLGRSDVWAEGPVNSDTDAAEALAYGTGAGRISSVGLLLDRMSPDSLADQAMGAVLERDLSLSVNAVISTMRSLEQPEGRKVLLLLAGRWPAGDSGPGARAVNCERTWTFWIV